jgi:sugar-specific transcriptional regulator TrmB
MTDIRSVLEEIGLTQSEIAVYIALIELGSSSTGPIVDKSRTNASKIYIILDKLIQKGLASYILKNNVKYYEAAEPERIFDYMDEKQKKITKQTASLATIIPELKLKQQLSSAISRATVFEGMKGLHAAFYGAVEKLDKDEEVLAMNIPKQSPELKRFFLKFVNYLSDQNIPDKCIFNYQAADAPEQYKDLNVEVKFAETTTPASINIIGDSVIIFPSDNDKLILFLIEDKNTAQSFRVQFYNQWNQNVTVRKGFDAFKNMIHSIVDKRKPGETYDVLSAGIKKSKNDAYEQFFNEITKYRLKKKVIPRLLFEQNSKYIIEKYPKNYDKSHTQVKFLPYEVESPVETFMEEDRAHLVIQDEDEPTIITIESKIIAQSFQKQFDSFWNQKVHTLQSTEAIKSAFTQALNHDCTYWIGGNGGVEKIGSDMNKFFKSWMKKRTALKKPMYDLVDFGTHLEGLEPDDTAAHKKAIYHYKQLPKGLESPMVVMLFGDFVLQVFWGKKTHAVLHENAQMVDSYMKYIKHFWPEIS